MADFLFEIGLEEVPARMLGAAQKDLENRVFDMMAHERLISASEISSSGLARLPKLSFSTPRRLAVKILGVLKHQPDLAEEIIGPSSRIAYKDGLPTQAAIAFAKKVGVATGELRTITTLKGEYLLANPVRPGRSAAEVLVEAMPKVLANIYWAKNMAWRAGKPERFVRPVRWLVALLGEEVVPISFAGYTAARETYGHRVLYGPAPIVITSPATYLDQLKSAFVLADVELRRHTIRKALDHVCRTIPAVAGQATRWREDHALVDKMTHMTEWPSVLAGAFEPAFLALPEEVLVTVMRDHQNYFAVEAPHASEASRTPGLASQTPVPPNKLAPHFLAVLNTAASPAGEAVIRHGNERVLRARFTDARFFWEFDQRTSLEDRVSLLENVTFQKDLGSYASKSLRVAAVAARLAAGLTTRRVAIDSPALATAARLAKTDLTTELVKEFTELQGEVGGLYARAQGIAPAAADAIYDQYRPTSMEDRIPRTPEGQVLAIADKADTIAGMFSLGMEPTGSKDPFALRRAANGIVKILAEGALPLTLADVIAATEAGSAVAAKMQSFFSERVEFYLREVKAQAYDVVKAVLAIASDDIRDAVARAEAVTAVRGSEDFTAVSAAFKRMKNILTQASEKGLTSSGSVNQALLRDASEKALATKTAELSVAVAAERSRKNYTGALEATATLRPQVDGFFDAVMVMDPDAEVRGNRLALLEQVLAAFDGIADFSEIVVAG